MIWQLAAALAQALMHSLWQLALLGLLAALSLTLLAGASARLRHAVGMGWLGAMLLAPGLSLLWAWRAPAQAAWVGAPGLALATPAAPLAWGGPAASALPWLDWLLFALCPLWLLGVLLMALRQWGGWRALRRVEAQPFAELPPAWAARVQALATRMGLLRPVAVRLAAHIGSPFSCHALRPVIWLPLGLLSGLPPAQLEALLAHELAHIRRLDWVWNSLQCAIELLLFYHPAMWWLSRRVREEREHACDDLALAAGSDALALAEALAGLHGQPAWQPVLAASGGHLLGRIRHLLARAPRRPGWRTPGLLLLGLSLGALLALHLARPPLLLTRLQLDASSSGALSPGQYREYNADYLGAPERRYRIRMDAQGQVHEQYSEDGRPKPLGAAERDWLAGVQAMSARPNEVPGLPDLPELPELPGLPDLPGLQDLQDRGIAVRTRSPVPTEFQSEAAQALAESLQTDPRLVARTGQPARYQRASFHGGIRTDGDPWMRWLLLDDPVRGQARFHMDFEGPQGRVRLHYEGRTGRGGQWQAERFELSPLP